MSYKKHYSVLKNEVLSYLTENTKEDEVQYFADLTFGGGGHSLALSELSDFYYVEAFDQDPEALKNGEELLVKNNLKERIFLTAGNFGTFFEYIKDKKNEILKEGGFAGILMDLGVSSHHFDKGERGFSFKFDAELDMRMNTDDDSVLTAKEIINSYSCEKLEKIFREYGEDFFSQRIAEKIVEERELSEITTTKQLENIIFHCYPKKMRHKKIHPATKCFQALRIEVNRELEVLEKTIPQLLPLLKSKGRLVIISFHSLEDRIVKNIFKKMKVDMNCRILTKKPIRPTEKELEENSRSRSAKLRVLEKN